MSTQPLRLARRMQGASGNVIREILKLTQTQDVLSFAGGLPSPDSFPTHAIAEITQDILARQGTATLQYGTTEGMPALREFIAGWLGERRLHVKPDDVLVLSGSQQGIDLLAKALLDPGDAVVVERPTYLAALQIFRSYEARIVTVPTDAEGLQLDALEDVLREHRPKLVYTIPTFQNPTGITLSEERRRSLPDLAHRYGAVVIEDDPYGLLRYRGAAVPPVKAFDRSGSVVYLGSFSKIVAPGLRVGYAVAPSEILRRMVIGKQGTDVHTSNLSQAIVAEFGRRGLLAPHIARISAEYGKKRDAMIAALARHMPAGTRWTEPEGGLFIWVTLAGGLSTTRLLEEAVRSKVAFIPGTPFFADGSGDDAMRLNFSNASLEEIDTGIARLGQVIRRGTEPAQR